MKTLTVIAALLVATTAAAQAKGKKTKPPMETWFCDVTENGNVKIYQLPGSGGGKRKRDAVCE